MNNINDLQEQLENIIKQGQELLEKMKEERISYVSKTKRWKPKKGESYWYVADHGRCVLTTSRCSELDEERFEFSNVYQTDKEAQKELDRRRSEQELLDMCDRDGDIEIRCNPNSGEFEASGFDCLFGEERSFVWSPYRFSTKESCQKAIDTLGSEKLKLIFRID